MRQLWKALTDLPVTLMAIAGLLTLVVSGTSALATQTLNAIPSAFELSQTSPFPTQPVTRQTALERLFTTTEIQSDWFTPTFLRQVALPQIQQIIASIKTELGAYQGVKAAGNDYQVLLQKGSIPTQIVVNEQGQIAGLFFQPPVLTLKNLDEALAEFEALPGQVSVLVLEGQTDRAALNATTPLAVGSAFKLAVLEALKQQIASGKKNWGDVVELQPGWKSLPSGLLQNWADGSLLTLQSLAALMISQSDNTATDSVIHLVDRREIEALSPRNRPFLTTREAFILKSSKHQTILQRYRKADETARRAILTEIAQYPLPDVSEFEAGNTIAPDVEWFFSTRELCTLIDRVKDLPLMSINPGVANAKDWERVAFKGGSEPGVLNLTTWLQAKNGKTYCVSATWNREVPLEESLFLTRYSTLLEMLKS